VLRPPPSSAVLSRALPHHTNHQHVITHHYSRDHRTVRYAVVVAAAARPWHNANAVALPFFASVVVVAAIEVAAIEVAAVVAAIQFR
jgi:hypothetical protein